MMTRFYKLLVCLVALLGLTAMPVFAHEEDEEYGEATPSVYWRIGMDAQGNATSDLSITAIKNVPDLKALQVDIAAPLEDALHCRPESISVHADKYIFTHNARCRMPVRKSGLLISGTIRPGALLNRLQQAGLSMAQLSLSVPRLAVNRGPDGSRQYTSDRDISYSILYKSSAQAISDISFEYGYTRRYVIRLASWFMLILAAPLALILFIRRKTLKLAAGDSTAAWFGYWRVHRWIAEGIWIVWLIALFLFRVETFLGFLIGRDSPVVNALAYVLPPGIVLFLCQYLTRPLWLKMRGVSWNRREMLVNGFWQQVAAVLPVVFIIIGIGSLVQHGAEAMLWFGAAVATGLVGVWKYGKATKSLPNALHGGELKEKILEMAHRAGVKIQQVLVMPASRLQMGNAFAMQGQKVMITDYLLERLTRQETECVMAHELGHVKKRHVLLLSWPGFLLMFLAVNIAAKIGLTLLPSFFAGSGMGGFKTVQWIDEYLVYPVSLISTVLFRYLLSRRFERSADEFAALLTNDPESMITGLVKLSKMNLMPLQWGRMDEGFSTHPSTLRRVEAIARDHNISRKRLQELLVTEPRREEGSGYPVDEVSSDPNLVFSTETKTKNTLLILLTMLATLSLPPLLFVRIIDFYGLPPVAYAGGILLMPAIYFLVTAYASLMGYGALRERLYETITRKGVRPGWHLHFTGIVPEPFPRTYDNNTVWDVGFLDREQGALAYYGDKITFRIPRENILAIARGKSHPGWFNVPEIYVTWTDGAEERVFHLHSLDGSSMLSIARRSGILLQELLAWHRGTETAGGSTAAEPAGLPAFPEVQGRHPRQSAGLKNFFGSIVTTAAVVFGLAAVLHLDSSAAWYGVGMVGWCLLLAHLPLWTYRDSAEAVRLQPIIPITDRAESPDTEFARVEKERKINRRLALGVGILGSVVCIGLVFLFFTAMVSNPGSLFKLMPLPAFRKTIQSDGKGIYLFSHKLDMSGSDREAHPEPRDRHFASVLEGTRRSEPQEIPAFVTAAGSDNGIILLGEGFFARYDGATVTEVKTEGIGKWPKGIATPGGLYVISRFKDGLRLARVQDASFTVIPLPDGVRTGPHDSQVIELARYGDQPALFWQDEAEISWTLWDGSSWMPAASQPFSGGFKVIGDEKALHFFHQEGYGPDLAIDHHVFENNEWQTSSRLPIPDQVTDWKVFLHRGTPMIALRRGSDEILYSLDKGRLVNPVILEKGAGPLRKLGVFALAAFSINLIAALAVSIVSMVMRKYKQRRGRRHDTYEFASLFRRFLANVIDAGLLLLLPLIVIWASLQGPGGGHKPLLSYTLAAYFIGGFLYHALCEGLFGATAGKKMCGIKVLKDDYTPIRLGSGFLRNAVRVVDGMFFYLVGAVAVSASIKWQRLGDMLAETVVVRNK